MNEFIIIYCTTPTKEEALKIANALVTRKLAACVNIIEGVTSVYEWQGELCRESECQMVIKSRKELFDKLKEEILSQHSYEVPEIISLPVSEGLDSYLNWVRENTIIT